MIGVFVPSQDAREAVETIRLAEERGVAAVWLTQAGIAPDSMAVLAAAAVATDRIKLGTAIIPTWPRAALRDGAMPTGGEPPPLIAHVPVCLSEDRDLVRQTARDQVGRYSQFPPYQAMFAAAGYGDVSAGLTDKLIDDLVVSGTERDV